MSRDCDGVDVDVVPGIPLGVNQRSRDSHPVLRRRPRRRSGGGGRQRERGKLRLRVAAGRGTRQRRFPTRTAKQRCAWQRKAAQADKLPLPLPAPPPQQLAARFAAGPTRGFQLRGVDAPQQAPLCACRSSPRARPAGQQAVWLVPRGVSSGVRRSACGERCVAWRGVAMRGDIRGVEGYNGPIHVPGLPQQWPNLPRSRQ